MQENEAQTKTMPGGKVSWGAFFLTFIWGSFNNVWISFLVFVPIVGLFTQFYLLFKGRKLAWEKGQWDSDEHFLSVQKKWDIAGFIIMFLLIASTVSTAIFIIPSLTNYKKKAMAASGKILLSSARVQLESDKIDTNTYSIESLKKVQPDGNFTIQTIETHPELAAVCPDCRITADSYKIAAVGNLDEDEDLAVIVIESGSDEMKTLKTD